MDCTEGGASGGNGVERPLGVSMVSLPVRERGANFPTSTPPKLLRRFANEVHHLLESEECLD